MSAISAIKAFYGAAMRCGLDAPVPCAPGPVLRLAIISEGTNTWPLHVAKARRLFEQEGVDVEVTLTGSSARQLDALTSGGYDVGFQQSDHIVRAVEGGADLFVFMALAHAPGLTLVAAPEIVSFAGLRGRPIAVDGARTGYALLLRRLLREQGLGEADCVFTEFGGSQERFDALKAGRAAASLLNPPFDEALLEAGFNGLGTVSQFFPDYPGPIAAARRSWAAHHRHELCGFIRAFDTAYDWLCEPCNRKEAMSLLPARLARDAAAAQGALDAMARRGKPRITSEGLRRVIDVVWEAEGYAAPPGAPEKYLDLELAREACRS